MANDGFKNPVIPKSQGEFKGSAPLVRYATAKKKNKKWVKAGGWKTITVGKKVQSKKLKLGFSKNYIVQVRAKKSYKHTYIDYGDFFFYGQKRTKIKYKYGKYSNKKKIRTGRKNTKIRLAEKKKWNECKKKGKKYNYNYEPKVQPGKSVYYYLQITKGKYGQKIKKVRGDSELKITKIKNNLYKVTVRKNTPECRLMIEAKTATSIASSDIYVPEKKTAPELNDPLLTDPESEEEYTYYWDISSPYTTYDTENCAECKKFAKELDTKIKSIVNSNPHNTNFEKITVLKKVADMGGSYPYFAGNCLHGRIFCQSGSSCIVRAAKLMGISDDRIWAQDGYPCTSHSQKLQNYKKCVINTHCGVCIQLGAVMWRFDSQGYTPYPDRVENQEPLEVWFFTNFNGQKSTDTFCYICITGGIGGDDQISYDIARSYYDEQKQEEIAFSKKDYITEKQEHPKWKWKGYWNDNQTKIIYVTDGQNP